MTTDLPSVSSLEALEQQARNELAVLAYPQRDWVIPVVHPSGQHVYDVVIIGAGQAALGTALALKREGVTNYLVLDKQTAGKEGVWGTFARMSHLRTPKATIGIDGGIPSLSAPAFYRAKYGEAAWNSIDRIERTRWMEFLSWFRQTAGITVMNETACVGLGPEGELIRVQIRSGSANDTSSTASPMPSSLLARQVVLATGYDGCGAWRIPKEIAEKVSPVRINHSNEDIDFNKFKGKRIGILGHGASAFDNAAVAFEHGAISVDLCFRREQIPTINPHRRLEFAGFLKHFYELDDLTRWRTNHFFETRDQPPTQASWDRAHLFKGFAVHSGSPWQEVAEQEGLVRVRTPHREFEFDHLICATGAVVDFQARDELRPLDALVKRWQDVLKVAPEDQSDTLGSYPYLGPGFEYLPFDASKDRWVEKIRAFNFSSIVSMGPHTTSASGHKYSIPRLVAGITSALMAQQSAQLLPALHSFQEAELNPQPPAFCRPQS